MAIKRRPVLSPGPTARSARGTQIRIANAGTSGKAANTAIQTRSRPKASRSAQAGCGDPFARERVVLAPSVPYRLGPAAHCPGVFLRRRSGDIGDRDLSADARDDGLFEVARSGEPTLDAVVHLLIAAVLDGDREASQMCGERTAGQDVPVVLTGVAVDGEAPHRGVARVLERTEAEVIEEPLAGIASADGSAALGTGLAGHRGLLAERVR